MSVKVLSRIWEHSRATGTDRLVLLAVADHADNDGVAWPGISTIAKKSLLSDRQCQRVIGRLIKFGEIITDERKGGRKMASLYLVTAGLDTESIQSILVSRFDLTPLEAQAALKNIAKSPQKGDIQVQKGDTCVTLLTEKKGDIQVQKGDIQVQKGDIQVQKGDIAMSPEPMNHHEPIEARKLQRPEKIQAYQIFVQESGKSCLTYPQINEIKRRVGADPALLDKWRQVVKTWILRGYKPTNVDGMLNWLENGIPTQGKSNSFEKTSTSDSIPPPLDEGKMAAYQLLLAADKQVAGESAARAASILNGVTKTGIDVNREIKKVKNKLSPDKE